MRSSRLPLTRSSPLSVPTQTLPVWSSKIVRTKLLLSPSAAEKE